MAADYVGAPSAAGEFVLRDVTAARGCWPTGGPDGCPSRPEPRSCWLPRALDLAALFVEHPPGRDRPGAARALDHSVAVARATSATVLAPSSIAALTWSLVTARQIHVNTTWPLLLFG